MKIWFIYRLTPTLHGETYSFVLRAKSELQARTLAANNCGHESSACWLDENATACEHVLATGKSHFLVRNTFCRPEESCLTQNKELS